MSQPNQNTFKTHCLRGHPFDSANTLIVKGNQRRCRTCANAANRIKTRTKHTPPAPLLVRFWDKVDIREPAECWEWRGQRQSHRYGVIRDGPKRRLAHRVSWELANGFIPDGMGVLHHCDNPPCVNPDHLFVGTQQDNMADMMAKGRSHN